MRYEVVESKHWRHTDGRTASIYGSLPAGEGWTVESRGFSIRDNNTNTVGLGLVPFPTREAAQAVADKLNARQGESQ